MTIKELENRTGMARANIRFYEGEGLLSPKRLDNGYRDYSEEDVRTLEKIKLLRQLQLDIGTIRRVQGGALTLERALFVQLTKLEGDRAVIERAAEVCRELERSGVEYAALEPRPWLRHLEAPQRAEIPAPSPAVQEEDGAGRTDEPQACRCPWQRYFARALDMALYDTLINVLWLLVFRDQSLVRLQTDGLLAPWLMGLALLALTLALEPLWLHFWGWTPGKWLFGLKLRNEDGDKLTLSQGRERSWQVFQGGYGWDIPMWDLWKMWQCRKLGLEGRDCHWDCEEGYRYTKVERRFSGWAFVGARALLGAALFLALLWSCLPPCRGELTVSEFARNYNHALRVQEYQGESLNPTLDEEGRWKEREQPAGAVTISLTGDTTEYDQPEFTLTDGRVTAVTLRMRSGDFIVSGGFQEALALEALARAGGRVHLFNILPAWGEAQGLLSRWENVEEDLYGVHVSQRVEYTGYLYTERSGYLLRQDGDIPSRCEKTVTISLIE